MKNVRWVIIAMVVLVLLLAAGWLVYEWKTSPEVSRTTLQEARITDISPMLQLCSVEILEDLPVKASVGSRHIFAVMSVRGSISFDIDDLTLEGRGDTVFVTLPREIVDIRESTEPGSYKVIDTWNDRFLGSSRFTAAEENAAKAKVSENYRRSLYRRGYVARARKEAVANLSAMLGALTRKKVVVTDPSPSGYPSSEG